MEVRIKTIPHQTQRYNTCGDWWWEGETLHIRVSNLQDWRKEMSVAYHELREALLCLHTGITQEEVDKFDQAYEDNRKEGDTSEPGDSKAAPYFLPHQYATRDERLLIADLDVDWNEYNNQIINL